MNANIFPNGLSDHHIVSIDFNINIVQRPKYYWHFNVKLLQDNSFCEKFRFFWEMWKLNKNGFENLTQWWEVGRTQIRVFCQQYSYNSTVRIKRKIKQLEKDLYDMEHLIDVNNEGLIKELKNKKMDSKVFWRKE